MPTSAEPIGRIEHEAERRDARRTAAAPAPVCDRLPKKKRTISTKHDAEAEGDQKLILVRPAVEVADDDPLHHHADDHHEQRAGDHRDDEGVGIGVGDIAGVAAEHEHRAMREVEHAERAVDDRQAGRDQRQQRAEHQPVEHLRNEISPIDHDSAIAGSRSATDTSSLAAHVSIDEMPAPRRQVADRRGADGLDCQSGVVAELAAERVRLLHQRRRPGRSRRLS